MDSLRGFSVLRLFSCSGVAKPAVEGMKEPPGAGWTSSGGLPFLSGSSIFQESTVYTVPCLTLCVKKLVILCMGKRARL